MIRIHDSGACRTAGLILILILTLTLLNACDDDHLAVVDGSASAIDGQVDKEVGVVSFSPSFKKAKLR